MYTRRIHRDTVEMQMPFSEEEENNTQSERKIYNFPIVECTFDFKKSIKNLDRVVKL